MPTLGNLRDIRAGLAAALEAIPGLRAVPRLDQINPPVAVIGFPKTITYDMDFGHGADTYTIPVRICVGLADNRVASDLLETYIAKSGANSVKVALEVDGTLDGACGSLRVTQMTGSGEADIGNITYLVADWDVEIYA